MRGFHRILGGVLLASLAGAAFAHGEHGVLYVAPDGADAGNCRAVQSPCKSLLYAVARAGKGDQVRVAAGTYEIDRAEGAVLVGDIVNVRGGYSTRDAFATANPTANPTFIVGPAAAVRDRLAERGMTLVQDQKGMGLEKETGDIVEIEQNAPTVALCEDGMAGMFPCSGVNLIRWMRLNEFSTRPSSANDIWGFKDLNTGREYALIGLRNGLAVVDVTQPRQPREIGTIPGPNSTWRDMDVVQFYDEAEGRWKAYAYCVADAVVQGLQVIDLTGLPDSISLANTYTEFSSAHTIHMSNVHRATGVALPGLKPYLFVEGSNLNGGAFRTLDISNPLAPVEVIKPSQGQQYAHDAASFVLRGARAAQCEPGHDPCEVYIDYNENTVDLWDTTDKTKPVRLSSTPYAGSGYTHSGWPTADNMFVFVQDELDEANLGVNTLLRTMDISDLRAPFISNIWTGPTQAIDHNGYVKGSRFYFANYRRGMTILDVSDPNDPQEIGFFDSYPGSDSAFFNGPWGVYPFLPSGTIVVSDIDRGLFILREQNPQ
jgi:choice-of-anchor B domain-containing protein